MWLLHRKAQGECYLNQNICRSRDNKNENHLTPSKGFLHLLMPIKAGVRGFLKTYGDNQF
jgi:hypothetical protein